MNAELHGPVTVPPTKFADLINPTTTEVTPNPMNRMIEARDRLRMLMGKKPLGPRTTTTQRPTQSTEPPMTEARMKVLEKLRNKPKVVMTNPFKATTEPTG